jgi:hypothetical protein
MTDQKEFTLENEAELQEYLRFDDSECGVFIESTIFLLNISRISHYSSIKLHSDEFMDAVHEELFRCLEWFKKNTTLVQANVKLVWNKNAKWEV